MLSTILEEDEESPMMIAPKEEANPGLLVVGFLCLRFLLYLWSLGLFAFHVVVVYALVTANTSAVFSVCGHSLWIFLLIHILLPLIVMCVLLVVLLLVYMLFVGLYLEIADKFHVYAVPLLMVLGGYTALCGLGVHYTQEAVQNAACNGALSEASGLGSPLLATVGWVYVALDSLGLGVTLCMLGGLLYIEYVLP